jgi:hypothetical protein
MHSTKPPAKRERRGGLRSPKGGRRTRYPNKRVTSLALTAEAEAALEALAAAHNASESDIVCHLILKHGRALKNLPPLTDAGS